MFILLPTHLLLAQESPVIHAASEIDYPPFCIVNEQGEADGFSVQLMREALNAVGYDVTFELGAWESVKKDLEFGRVEALPLVGRTPEREDIFDFTFPYLTLNGTVVVREETHDITGIEDLGRKKVAVMQGDNAHEYVLRTIPTADIIATDTFSQALRKLSTGEADAVIIQRLVALQLINELGLEDLRLVGPPISDFKQSWSFAVQEDNHELLATLNEGLSMIIANGTYERLLNTWLGDLLGLESTYERILVGGDENYPPYEFLDENGEPTGFNVDLTWAIADEIGIDVEIVLDTWANTYGNLLKGNIDIVQGVFYSTQRDRILNFTQPHSVISHVIVTREGEFGELETIEDLRGLDILVMQEDIMQNRIIELGMKDHTIPVKDQEEALSRLSRGEADCALVAELPARYYFDKLDIENLKIRGEVFSPDYGYAVLDGKNESLLLKFSEGLSTLKANGIYREIHNKWFGVYERGPSALQVIKTFAYILIPIGVFVLLVLLWSQMLRKKVKQKTAELEHEVDENKAAHKEIAAQFEWLRTTLRSIGDGVITTDRQGHVQLINRVAEQLTGWPRDEARGRGLSEIFHIIHEDTGKIIENPVTRVLEKGSAVDLETQTVLVSRDGSRYNIADSAAPIKDEESRIVGIVLVFRDVTEDIRIQEEMQRTAKLDSIGILAGGIAHDFNNMLSGIFGYAQLAMESVDKNTQAHEYLDEILGIFGRARDLTQQLLTFSKGGSPKRETRDVKKIIEESVNFSLSGSKITCTYELDERLWPCNVDENQIGQVMSNLVINAQQAMPDGGTVIIRAHNREILNENEYLLKPGFYVEIAVNDTGEGISHDIKPHIFDPFFTTKQEGHGLGLATCYSIIQKHEGNITVQSEPGEGTTFYILLPRSPAPERASDTDFPVTRTPLTGVGTILLMDDEESIREVLSHMLRSMGFSVIVQSNGHQVLEYCRDKEARENLSAIFLDLTIPGSWGGKEIIGELRERLPDLPIFASSGYSQNDVMARPQEFGFTESLAKPFEREELVRLLANYVVK
jgi:two-component system sensor histidine kinase EvgS